MTLLRWVNLERRLDHSLLAKIIRTNPLSDLYTFVAFFICLCGSLRVKFSPPKIFDKRVGIGVIDCPLTESVPLDF